MNRWLPVVLIFLFIALSVSSAFSESLTFDEIVHAEEGINALTRHTFLIDTNNPPLIREIAMLPMVLGAGRLIQSALPAMQLFPARFVIILLGAALLIAVYRTTKHYFGRTQALVALFLLSMEPTLLANSHYVTLDTGFTLFFFLSYIAFIRLMEAPSVYRFILTAGTFGLAAASKMLALPFFVGCVLVSGLSVYKNRFNKFMRLLPVLVGFIAISGLFVWATYFFVTDVVITAREDSDRLSSRLHLYAKEQNNIFLEKSLRILETAKVPLGSYAAVVKNTIIRSARDQETFFFGTFYAHSRWYFLPVNLLYKLPLPLWVLFVLGLMGGLSVRKNRRTFVLFLIPFFVILAITSYSNIQPWIRYVLPALPFMIIIASQSVSVLFTRYQKVIFLFLCLWHALSVNSAFPHYISYANELAGAPKTRFTRFMDSNLDWGQVLPDIAGYINESKPSHVRLSYFGRDDGAAYGLASTQKYGSHRYEDICAFHEIPFPFSGRRETIISVSNWYYCKFWKDPMYSQHNVKAVVGTGALIFYE